MKNSGLFDDYTFIVTIDFDGKRLRQLKVKTFKIYEWLKARGCVPGQVFKVYALHSTELLYTKDARNGIIKRTKRDLK